MSKQKPCWRFACAALVTAAFGLSAQTDQEIYTDSLQNNWQDWGWATIDYNQTAIVHSGSKAISVTIADSSWQAIYLHHGAMSTSPYTDFSFWIHGGASGGQQLQVRALISDTGQAGVNLPPLQANSWQQVTIPLADLGVANEPNFTGFWIQDRIGSAQPTFYLDDLLLKGAPAVTNLPVSITVDALQDRHPINPMIYGVNFASTSELEELSSPINRSGGNAQTRYNWQLNAFNRARDWYFESIGASSATPGADGDEHVQTSKDAGAEPMLTVPMVGWMPKLGPGRSKLASYSIAKYGPQTDNDWQWFPDAGNGISATNNTPITWNDPNDANFPTNSAFQQAWIQHLTNTWGVSTNGGVRYYCMDNEYSLWHHTHQDIRPAEPTMQEIRDLFFDYGQRVKEVDPGALLVAPEDGWSATLPDGGANGDLDFIPWFLDQARQFEVTNGSRLLDVFSLHYYPQGGEFDDDVSASMQRLRNRSTRSLWDTNYVDASWVNNVVKLIPRMKEWVDTYYPGTRIGVTEYNWGAENHINGATTQADILGIFGREGLDYGTRWTTPSAGTPTFKAIKMYRNYDGSDSTFGDISVFAGGPDPDDVSTFAAIRSSDNALTLMVINKHLTATSPASITLTNFLPLGTAEVWQLTSANVISRLSDISITGNTFSNTVPPQSITLFVVPGGSRPNLRDAAMSSSDTFNFWLDGQPGQQYVIQSSSDFAGWTAVQTNVLVTNSLQIVLPANNNARFYRAQWLP